VLVSGRTSHVMPWKVTVNSTFELKSKNSFIGDSLNTNLFSNVKAGNSRFTSLFRIKPKIYDMTDMFLLEHVVSNKD